MMKDTIQMSKNRFEVKTSFTTSNFGTEEDIRTAFEIFMGDANMSPIYIAVTSSNTKVTYGLGEEFSKDEYEMWMGPFTDIRECLCHKGRSDMSRVVKFNVDGKINVDYKWSVIGECWSENK